MPSEQTEPQRTPEIILSPGHAFFARLLDLPADLQPREVEAFARLSIEGLSPFPPQQLAAGWHLWPEARRLLVFAAYRKSLAGSQAEWDAATLVAPDFAPALVFRPIRERPCLVLWHAGESVAALFWPQGAAAPAHFGLRRLPGDAPAASLAPHFLARLGIAQSTCDVLIWSPPPEGGLQPDGSGVIARSQPDPATGDVPVPLHLAPAEVEAWDIRPADFLEARRTERRNALRLWHGLIAVIGVLALLLVGEIAHTLLGGWAVSRAKLLSQRTPDAQAVEDSDQLARRLQQLTLSQLKPFEKLEYIGNQLPDSVHFTRMASTGLDTLTIDAVARNPGDVPILEGRLQQLPRVEKASTTGQQVRDNLTTFNLEVVFKRGEEPVAAPDPAPAEIDPVAAEAAARAAEDTTTVLPDASASGQQNPAGMETPPAAVPEGVPGLPPDFTPPPPPPPPSADEGLPPTP